MKLHMIAGALAIVVASPAMAQDDSQAGGRVVAGAFIGIDSVNAEFDGLTDAEEGILPGATVGYEYETQSGVILGIEAEYSDSAVSVSAQDTLMVGDRLTVNAGRDFYVGGRLGIRTGRNGFLYAKAGYSNATIEVEYDDGLGELADEEDFNGWRIGVGGEVDLGTNYALRVEYRYTDYGEIEALGVATGVEISRNQGIVTLLGRF